MCYSLSLQSSIDFRNRNALKINGDRAILTSNLATLPLPSLPERDRRGKLFLSTGRGVGSLRFIGNTSVDLCGTPRHRLRVSCSDARRTPAEETTQPNFSEFITSERVKVVAMLALALALCNADRVVMSVAIVPLSLSRGWSKSFSGIVQVNSFKIFEILVLIDCFWLCLLFVSLFFECFFFGSHRFYGDT